MVITILAIVLGFIMTVGGLVPNVANGMLETKLKEALNQPEYLRVKVYPTAPSSTLLDGQIAYTEIDAKNFVLSDLPIDAMSLRIDHLNADTSGKQVVLREPTQGLVRVKITEAGLNRFIQSDTFRALLDDIRKRQELAQQLDADLSDLAIDLQNGAVKISGQAVTMGGFFTIPFEVAGQLQLANERHLVVGNVKATTLERPLPDDMIQSILVALNPILDLGKLSNQDMQLYFRQLVIHEDFFELIGEAELKKIPQLGS